MKPLFHCSECGFLSTWASEYTRQDGNIVCKACAKKALEQGMKS